MAGAPASMWRMICDKRNRSDAVDERQAQGGVGDARSRAGRARDQYGRVRAAARPRRRREDLFDARRRHGDRAEPDGFQGRPGRVRQHRRAVRLREVDVPQDRQRPLSGDRRADRDSAATPTAAGPRPRDGLPGLVAVPLVQRSSTTCAYGLVCRRRSRRAQARAKARPLIDLVSLAGFEKSTRTSCRAACSSAPPSRGRSSYDPAMLLMDEPFAALDAMTRELMQARAAAHLGACKDRPLRHPQIDEAISSPTGCS